MFLIRLISQFLVLLLTQGDVVHSCITVVVTNEAQPVIFLELL